MGFREHHLWALNSVRTTKGHAICGPPPRRATYLFYRHPIPFIPPNPPILILFRARRASTQMAGSDFVFVSWTVITSLQMFQFSRHPLLLFPSLYLVYIIDFLVSTLTFTLLSNYENLWSTQGQRQQLLSQNLFEAISISVYSISSMFDSSSPTGCWVKNHLNQLLREQIIYLFAFYFCFPVK